VFTKFRKRKKNARLYFSVRFRIPVTSYIYLILCLVSTESEEDFSWEDEEDSTPPTAKPATTSSNSLPEKPSEKALEPLSAPPSETPTPANTSPRESSEESYDVVSSDNGSSSTKGKREPKKTGEPDDGDDSDWE
jgi:type IV secretory pathway VirB10-like protein